MNKEQFDKIVLANLIHFNKGQEGWYWNHYKKEYATYKHILYLPERCKKDKIVFRHEQEKVVIESCLVTPAKEAPFLLRGHLHPNAHHLNSSQVMCYNFFRPLISNKENPTRKLFEIFQSVCQKLEYDENAIVKFEYIERGENTNFDFILHTKSIKIYCEIKYTEPDFGIKCESKRDNHFQNQYADMVDKCSHLWKREVDKNDFMNKYFQLFRNVIRARTDNDYVFFICPQDRDDLKKSFDSLKNTYLKEGVDNVQFITWESLIEKAKSIGVDVAEFEDRYFSYKKL